MVRNGPQWTPNMPRGMTKGMPCGTFLGAHPHINKGQGEQKFINCFDERITRENRKSTNKGHDRARIRPRAFSRFQRKSQRENLRIVHFRDEAREKICKVRRIISYFEIMKNCDQIIADPIIAKSTDFIEISQGVSHKIFKCSHMLFQRKFIITQ